MTKVGVGEWIKNLRRGRKLSQSDLAHELGLDQRTLSDFERSARTPSDGLLLKITGFFNAGMEWLLRDQNKVTQEDLELFKLPPLTVISQIQDHGIASKTQLIVISTLLEEAYESAVGFVTTAWVISLIKAFGVLSNCKIKNIDKLMPYFISTFPAQGGDLQSKMKNSLVELEAKEKTQQGVYHGYATLVARCFAVLCRDGDFTIPDNVLTETKELLEPWCFWAAKAALTGMKREESLHVFFILSEPTSEKKDKSIKGNHGVWLDVMFAKKGEGIFKIGQRPFSCSLNFNHAAFSCAASGFYNLIKAASLLGEINPATFKEWILLEDDKNGAYFIQREGTRLSLSKAEFKEAIKIIKEAAIDKDIQRSLIEEHVEKFGAL